MGDNNNPSVRQFIAAYRKILVHAEIREGSSGNCVPLENISVLHVSSRAAKSIDTINNSCGSNNILVESENLILEKDHDYDNEMGEIVLNEITQKIVVYIAGYIVSFLKRKLKCIVCINGLVATDVSNEYYCIIKAKQKGGLNFPSEDIIRICQKSEEVLKLYLLISGGKYLNKMYSIDFLTTSILSKFSSTNIFNNLQEHMFEQSASENHIIHLIKTISYKYLSLRINYLNRSESHKADSLRKVYGKLILHRGT